MTPRERILTSIRHSEPDRVPIDLGATPSSGISATAYNRLKIHLGSSLGKTRVYDVVQQLAQPEDEILDRFGVDVLDIGRTFNTLDEDWYDTKLSDGSVAQYPRWFRPSKNDRGEWRAYATDGTEIALMLEGMPFFDQTCFPYIGGYPSSLTGLGETMQKVHWSALAHSPWDNAGRSDFWQILREKALALRRVSDRAIMIVCGCNLFEWGTFLRRIDNFLMDLVIDPSGVERLLDALMEIHLSTLKRVCEAVGDVADIIRFGDDLGTDSGPFMAPEVYRKLFKPRHAVLCDFVKRHSSMHTLLHSCGSIYDLLPDLIEGGFEIVNPVQTSCYKMNPERLKNEFGKDIVFWGGGCDTQTVLNHATPKQVRDHVFDRLRIFSPGGGFVFNAVHNILSDVAPENVLAMYQAIKEFNS
jgi:uroporphyrinogen decarboxylase